MKILKCGFVAVLLLVVCQLAGVTGIYAQTNKNWKFSIAPYAWLTSISGKVGAKGYSAKGSQSFTSLTGHLNFAGMLAVEIIAYDTVGFTGNINMAMLGDRSTRDYVELDGKSTMILSDAALFYRLGSVPLNDRGSMYVIFDVLGGVRIWNFNAKLDVRIAGNKYLVSQRETWVDPIIGAKAWVKFSDEWNLELRCSIGGFGVNSDLTWDTSVLLGYTLWGNNKLLAGYRVAGVDFSEGHGRDKFVVDGVMHGPIVGLLLRF